MASLVLGALIAGGAVGQGIGTAVGVIATTIIDQALILPTLFPTPDPTPPTLQDIELQTVAEGSPISRFYGDQVRVTGQLIWRTDLIAETTSGGGKGFGPKAKAGSQNVFGNCAIAFGVGHPLARLVAMWADEKLIYHESIGTEVPLNSTDHELLRITAPFGVPNILATARLRRKTTVGTGEDLAQFRPGQTVDIHGVEPKLNVVAPAGSPTDPDTVKIHRVVEGVNPFIQFTPNQPNWIGTAQGSTFKADARVDEFPKPWNPADALNIFVYPGSESQLPDAFIESVEGAGNVEAYRGIAYVVFERFNVTGYGNRYPNISAIWSNNQRLPTEQSDSRGPQADVGYNLQNALIDVISNSGVPRESFDIRGVRLFNGRIPKITGLSVRGPQTTTKILQPLLIAGQLLAQEDNGVLKFFLRTRAETVIINPRDLAAHEVDEGSRNPLSLSDTAESKAPSSIEVHFNDEDQELQPGHVRERRIDHVVNNITSMRLPLSMSVVQAQAVAKAHLWTVLANRKQLVEISLPPSYLLLGEGDRVRVQIYGETFTFLLTKVDRGENFIIRAEGVVEVHDTLLFADESVAIEGPVTSQPLIDPALGEDPLPFP